MAMKHGTATSENAMLNLPVNTVESSGNTHRCQARGQCPNLVAAVLRHRRAPRQRRTHLKQIRTLPRRILMFFATLPCYAPPESVRLSAHEKVGRAVPCPP